MTPKLLTRQTQGVSFTQYDFLPGQSRRLLFPVKKGSIQELLSQVIVALATFPVYLKN